MSLTLLIGGARSGKSALAVRMAASWPGPVTVVATGEARDEEMRARIERHRAERPEHWSTIEEPIELARTLGSAPEGSLVIVDCLTLWVANLLDRGQITEVEGLVDDAVKAAASRATPLIVVTNEVGSGIVPANEMARSFRDLLGTVNSAFARAADRVLLVVAGRALPLPPTEEVTRDLFPR